MRMKFGDRTHLEELGQIDGAFVAADDGDSFPMTDSASGDL